VRWTEANRRNVTFDYTIYCIFIWAGWNCRINWYGKWWGGVRGDRENKTEGRGSRAGAGAGAGAGTGAGQSSLKIIRSGTGTGTGTSSSSSSSTSHFPEKRT
jgi:hypothetical protein